VLYIGLPIILGSIAQNIIAFTDTAFLGRVGEVSLGASAIGGLFYLTFVMLAFGFGIGAQIIMARRFGEGKLREIGNTWSHALLFLLGLALVVFLFFEAWAPTLLNELLDSDAVRDESLKYLKVRAFGLFFAYINITYRALYIAIGRTMIITWTTVVMAVVNIFLDYVLIFGKMGFPEMGIEGAALASVAAELSTTIFVTLYSLKINSFKRYGLIQFGRVGYQRFKVIFKVASPMMLTNFFSLFVWFIFFMIIEKLGESELAVSQLIRSVYIILLLPVWGFSSATNSMVSYYIGRNRHDMVGRVIKQVVLVSALSVLAMVLLVQWMPYHVLRIYTDQEHLIQAALPVLRVISGASVFLGIAFVVFNGVSGTGKTMVALMIEIVALSIYLAFAWSMTNIFNGGVAQVWAAEYVYAILLTLFSWVYLSRGNWRKARI
jgi:putative MATE family efflux protein